MGFTLGHKFNEGTDWEFTVSNETIAQAVQAEGGITEADIADYCYVAFIDQRVSAMVPESGRNVNDGLYPWATEYCPIYNTNSGAHPSQLKMNVGVLSEKQAVCYERNLLTCYADIGGVTGHYLVMDIKDIKKWMVNCDSSGAFGSIAVTSTAGFNGINDTIYYYDTNHVPIIEPVNGPSGTQGNLFPLNVVNINEELWIGFFTPMSHSKDLLTNEHLTHQAWDYAYSAGDIYNNGATGYIYQAGTTNYQCWCSFTDLEFPTSSGTTTGFDSYIDADGFNVIHITGQYGNNQNPFVTNCMMGNMFKTIKALHTVQSWVGLLFYSNNILYKPIIEGGLVTGFTSDMDIPSEWDNMTNVTGNNISPTPPSPAPSEGDDFDDHVMGAGSQLSGIAQLWVLTREQLIALHAAFANAPVNYDPMSSFISIMGVGISVLRVVGDSMPWTLNPINIKMSNGETWHTGVEGHIVDKQVSAFNEPNLRVLRKYNNFLDYSPYATHEIFLPMCGWITLPDIAVDRGITVTYIPDIETLKVRAVVSVVDNSGNRCVIGEKDGVMGAEIPFTNIGHSLFLGNTVVQSADIAGEIVTGAIGAGFTKTNAQGGKFRPYEGFTVGMAGTLPGAIGNALVSGNVNRTHFTTGNGSRIGFGDGENIQIKSIYHRIDKPNNYDHTVGKVCNKTGKLSEFTGFTVCDNPHINFSATEREKEEIKQLLEQGVIL